jgi:hypothetical protein
MLRRRIGICEVVFELGEDVGLKAGGQIDSAERSLAGMVASLFIAASVRTKPAKRKGFAADATLHVTSI